MSTAHNEAKNGEIAKCVLMPGDPLRAKFIAETFLEDAKLVNQVRNMLAFTGTYKGKEVTVMASGMGMPSIGIYSYELFSQYGVEQIIRIGSAGAYTTDLKLRDVVLADSVWSESNYAKRQKVAEELGKKVILARVHSSDVFYTEDNVDTYADIYRKHGCTCVDMESFALFHNANVLGKKAACLLTISDSLATGEEASTMERQTSFTDMMEIALNASI